MMRHIGNTVAKSCRKGKLLQYRDFSSASDKDVITAGQKFAEYCYKGLFCGVGVAFGGVTSSPVAKTTQESEETLLKRKKLLDEDEARLESLMKRYHQSLNNNDQNH